MYNTNTASVNLKVTALTSDTLYRLAELLTGNRYAALQFTADECKAIEMNSYVANMGAESKESAWTRFCELCTADKAISDTVKDRLGMVDSDRYEVRTFTAEGDTESCIIADVTLEAVLICYDIPTHEEKTLPLVD